MGDTGTDQRALCEAALAADAARALADADADADADASALPPTSAANGAVGEQPLDADASPPGLVGLTLAERAFSAINRRLTSQSTLLARNSLSDYGIVRDTPRVDIWRSMVIWRKMKERQPAKLKNGEYYAPV
jgi:hypothetical protein